MVAPVASRGPLGLGVGAESIVRAVAASRRQARLRFRLIFVATWLVLVGGFVILLGMTDRQTMRRIVLPQAIRIVIPAIGNEFIAMIKDSALVSFVALQELFWRARTVGSSHFQSFSTLVLAALVYWALTIVFSVVQ